MNVLNKIRKLIDKDYRDAYMQTLVRSGIAYQMQALRKKFGLSQAKIGEKVGKPQSVISRLENEEYGGVSVQSLLDIASGLDVALLVRFVPYTEFLRFVSRSSEQDLQSDTVFESLSKLEYNQFSSESRLSERHSSSVGSKSHLSQHESGLTAANRNSNRPIQSYPSQSPFQLKQPVLAA